MRDIKSGMIWRPLSRRSMHSYCLMGHTSIELQEFGAVFNRCGIEKASCFRPGIFMFQKVRLLQVFLRISGLAKSPGKMPSKD
ncbi:MAG: hypothetical protein CL534_09075 [Ahrensia sp.]|nr:hypothetical protein [Ahrensia sp.]